jgi:hypothetical protein
MGIEPIVSAWKANRLPLTDTRIKNKLLIRKGWDSNPWSFLTDANLAN